MYNEIKNYDSAFYHVREMLDLKKKCNIKENAAGYLISGETYYNR